MRRRSPSAVSPVEDSHSAISELVRVGIRGDDRRVDLPVAPPVDSMPARLRTRLPADDGLLEPEWEGFGAVVVPGGTAWKITSRDHRPLERRVRALIHLLDGAPSRHCTASGSPCAEERPGAARPYDRRPDRSRGAARSVGCRRDYSNARSTTSKPMMARTQMIMETTMTPPSSSCEASFLARCLPKPLRCRFGTICDLRCHDRIGERRCWY